VVRGLSGRVLFGGDLNGGPTFADQEMVEASANAKSRGEWWPISEQGPCPDYDGVRESLPDVFFTRPPMYPLTHDASCGFQNLLSDHERVQVMVAIGR
jgi:hypothetical protein